jgi:exodeoxyribonuclease VII small subunit
MSKRDMTFEEAMLTLEQSIKRLESGELTLDESLSEFESSIKLVKLCQKKLDGAKQMVRILLEDSDGCVTDAPFTDSGDDEA